MTRRIRVARAEGLRRRAAERKVTPAMVATAVEVGRIGSMSRALRIARPAYPRRAHVLYRAATMLQRQIGGQ